MEAEVQKQISVLLIDKSMTELDELETALRIYGNCEIRKFDNINSAIRGISSDQPDLIITEWALKDYTAAELLQLLQSRAEWKDIPVLLCTANKNPAIISRARRFGARQIFSKPINQNMLSMSLKKLFPTTSKKAKSSGSEDDIRKQLLSIDKLAPPPLLVSAIIEVNNDPHSSGQDLAEVVKQDQSLTSKILKIVNSAYYGMYRKVGNINHAIVLLGFEEVKNITLAACVLQNYSTDDKGNFDWNSFWLHSLEVANIASKIAEKIPKVKPDDAFVVGLLHDFGKVILHQYFPDLFNIILENAEMLSLSEHQVSRKMLGIDHAEIGEIVARSWKFPEPLLKAIANHHTPSIASSQDLDIHIAHISNYFAHRFGMGKSGNPVPDKPYEKSLELLGLKGKDPEAVWESFKIDSSKFANIIESVE